MKSEQAAVWDCSYCDKVFRYESEKKRHEASHVPQFECSVCAKKFSFLSALRRHEKQHERTGSVLCKECGGKFRDEMLLKRHIQYAHKGSFSCSHCESIFQSELALRTHMKRHNAESERKYHCRFKGCGRSFNFPHHLKHHELTHTNDKQHFCKLCHKGFIQSHHLKIHMKTHDPDNWLTCDEYNCSKKFANEYALKRHQATHKNKPARDKSNSDDALREKKPERVNSKYDDDDDTHVKYPFSGTLQPYFHNKEAFTKDDQYNFSVRSLELSINEISDNIVEAENIVKLGDEDRSIRENIADCKDVIGECISDENCLCSQINSNLIQITRIESLAQNNVPINSNVIKFDGNVDSILNNGNKICNTESHLGCQCNNCSDNGTIRNDILLADEAPAIEYRSDGIVRLKDTFDLDLDNLDNKNMSVKDSDINEIKRKYTTEQEAKIPFNTCKDVLGDCIVSGDGTIGDGCLCAKMAVYDQTMISQEIEDITPCPKNTWLSQRLQ